MRVMFYGDNETAVVALEWLLKKKINVAGVVLSPEPRNTLLAEYAKKRSIQIFQPLKIYDPQFLETIRSLKIELNFSVNYSQIFREPLISLPKYRTVNIHNGLIPNYRGGGCIYGAFINGERFFGQSFHYVDEGIDTGRVIVQQKIPINLNDTMAEGVRKSIVVLPRLLEKGWPLVEKNSLGRERPKGSSYGSYFPKKPDGDEIIDWSEPSLVLYNKIRARNPGPGNVTYMGDRKFIIWSASLTKFPKYRGPAGQVIGIEPGRGVYVKTGDSALLIQDIQWEESGQKETAKFKIGTAFLANWRQAYLDLKHKTGVLEKKVAHLEAAVILLKKAYGSEVLSK